MIKISFITVLLGATILFTGCSSKDSDKTDSGANTGTSQVTDLDTDTDTSETTDSDVAAGSTTTGSITSLIDGRWALSIGDGNNIYTIANGTINFKRETRLYKQEIESTLTPRGEKRIQPNNLLVKMVEEVVVSSYMTPLDSSGVRYLESSNSCGYTNWEINVGKDMLACETESSSTGLNIYYLNENTIQWGDHQQIGSDGYPEALDSNYHFIRL